MEAATIERDSGTLHMNMQTMKIASLEAWPWRSWRA